MAGVNTTTLGDLIVRVYDRGTIEELQNLEVPLLNYLGEARDFTVGGKGLYFPVNASGDEGYGFVDENSPLPAAQNEQVLQAQVNPRVFVGAVRITGLGRAISMRDPHSFASGLQYHLDEKLRRMTVYREGALFRDGTGTLCALNGAPPADTTATPYPVDTPGALWLRRNMVIDFKSGAGVTVGTAKLVDVDRIAGTILLDTNLGTGGLNVLADNQTLHLAGTQPTGSIIEREYTGLASAIATTGTYLGLPRTGANAVPEWEGNVVDAGSTDLDEDRLLQAENRVLIVGGMSQQAIRAFKVLIHPNQRRKYFELVVPQKQFTGLALDAGYSKLTWNGHEMLETHNAPPRRVWMGDLSRFQKFMAPDGDLKLDTVFGPAIKWAPGFDAGIGYFRSYDQYAVRKPNAFVLIDNLNDVLAA